MKFVIYDEGEMIIDPVTDQPLEKLELVKGEVEIIQVQQKISIGESFKIKTKTVEHDVFYDPFGPTKQTYKVEEPLTREKIQENLPTPLKVGDLVRSLE